MSKKLDFAKDLISFIDNSSSMFHSVKETKDRLLEAGFIELDIKETWNLEKGNRYFTTKNSSALVAFQVGKKDIEDGGFRIIGAHSDSPAFRIKPNPEMNKGGNYLSLNTEVYGGPILNTWLDRPLSIAGRVTLRGENPFNPVEKLVRIDEPILIIPNLAIHMNREVNSGVKLNPQEDILPILTLIEEKLEKEDFLLKILGEELNIDYKDILDFELYLYATEKGEIIGLNKEFISVGRLDDLAMVHAGLEALIESDNKDNNNVLVVFDNEEVGSETKQGAGSPFLKNILKRIALGTNKGEEEFLVALENSFLISADMAHAIHPNYLSKADPTNKPLINKGPVIKIATNQAYTTDSNSSAVYEELCRLAEVPVQKFVNRSDSRGGSTIGPISSSQLAIDSVDIGNPVLAMHSVRELGGVEDHYYVYKSFLEFYK